MTYQIFQLPKATLVSAGEIKPGWKVSFFLTGTTTPTPVYTTSALSTAHTQPVEADSGGVMSAIYLDPAITYKASVYDENDVLQYTVDPVNDSVLSQAAIGAILYPRTAAEQAAGVTPTNEEVPSHDKCGFVLPERYGTNTIPGTTDMAAALDAASAVAAVDGGTVLLSNVYARSTSWAMLEKVNILGTGYGSGVEFADTDGLTIDFHTGFGKLVLDNFYINGGGATRRAIYRAGTTDSGDELYGLHLSRLLITNFNVPILLRSVRLLVIEHCWLQNCDSGIELTGAVVNAKVINNVLVYASGNGTGNERGIFLDNYAYSVGGTISPEGVRITQNQIYGFETDIYLNSAINVVVRDNDLNASEYGIEFTAVLNVLDIEGNYIELSGSAAVVGVAGHGLGSAINSQINIRGNNFIGVSTSSATGVRINDGANQYQDNVTIADNLFFDFTNRDIEVTGAANCSILDNHCRSSSPTYSIYVDSVFGAIYIDRNTCVKDIYFDPAEAAAGEVILGHNIKNGSTACFGAQIMPTVASATALTLPLGAEAFKISGTTNITSVVATGWIGRTVRLVFQDVLTFTDGSNLKLAGNLTTSADDSITLVCDGTNWFEVGRSVN